MPPRQTPRSGDDGAQSPTPTPLSPGSEPGSAAASTAAVTVKTQRRSHRKSRNGCVECKRRHIRCDERRPACANCTIAERTCLFPPAKERKRTRNADANCEATQRHHYQRQQTYSLRSSHAKQDAHHSEYAPSPATWSNNADLPSGHPTPHYGDMDNASTSTPGSGNGGNGGPDGHQSLPMRSQPSRISFEHSMGVGMTSQSTTPLPSFGETFPCHSPYDYGTAAHTPADSTPSITSAGASNGNSNVFSVHHLALLHHIETSQGETFFLGGNVSPNLLDIAIRDSAEAPYLIDEFLALSAVHLAHLHENDASLKSHYQRLATELQTRAITAFSHCAATTPPDDTSTSVPRFLFASVLGLHDLADTLAMVRKSRDSEFHVLVDRFADCFRIHHGVRAILRPVWSHIATSELEPLIMMGEKKVSSTSGATPEQQTSDSANHRSAAAATPDATSAPPGARTPRPLELECTGTECKPLYRLVESSDLGPATIKACLDAIDRLQWTFDRQHKIKAVASGPRAASAFSVTVSPDFVDVLRRLQPEALVILAYFGVLLHRCRHFWVFGDAGACTIRAIAQHLGGYWRESMAWPLEAIEKENGEQSTPGMM